MGLNYSATLPKTKALRVSTALAFRYQMPAMPFPTAAPVNCTSTAIGSSVFTNCR